MRCLKPLLMHHLQNIISITQWLNSKTRAKRFAPLRAQARIFAKGYRVLLIRETEDKVKKKKKKNVEYPNMFGHFPHFHLKIF